MRILWEGFAHYYLDGAVNALCFWFCSALLGTGLGMLIAALRG